MLLCCDLDRTVIPNGADEESPMARPLFRELAARPEVLLAYVSGRHIALIDEAIAEYGLPVPDYAVGDVGTTIYRRDEDDWLPVIEWAREIGGDWGTLRHADIVEHLSQIDGIVLQPPDRQNLHKLSFFVDLEHEISPLLTLIRERLANLGIRFSLIWSVDEAAGMGLLDVLPASATKLHAVEFLARRLSIDDSRLVFAGDSGNDLPVLCSGHQAVLVRNAAHEVRDAAVKALEEQGMRDLLYIARGDFMGMNGNYCAGVLEGVRHFIPEAGEWLGEVRA
ncbi:MAG: HAD-IIB family hydrolase [Gammaproteobacteria bacterium]|nr:HAD-IIB family hydrolase [Gammaproteobacteria bacterium]